MKGY
jgi:hypothetical protein